MTRSFHQPHPHPAAGLFRPADHVLAVPQGSAVMILDLDKGTVYATTPFGAAAWTTLVGDTRAVHLAVAELRTGPRNGKGSDAWARIAGYLLDRRLIEPAPAGAGNYRGESPIR